MRGKYGLGVLALASVWLGRSLHSRAASTQEPTVPSFHRPLLEILVPKNGQVIEASEVDIQIIVRDFMIPTPLRDSKVCVGMNDNVIANSMGKEGSVVETCFDQTDNKVFHATGLLPGSSYTVRVELVERGNVMAISMRYFRVAAIAIPGYDGNVTISAALQHAIALHQNRDTDSASSIYRNILAASPNHGHALHLLGLVFYQSGNPIEAISYIEQALQGNSTFEEFHNSMGLCLKDLGRTAEAQVHFEKALKLRPSFLEARFNLGTLWQAAGQYDQAINTFVGLVALIKQGNVGSLPENVQQDVFARLCNTYRGMEKYSLAFSCYNDAMTVWPDHPTFRNERGNLYMIIGDLDGARDDYKVATESGNLIAHLNMAVVLETLGETQQSIDAFTKLVMQTAKINQPYGHIIILQTGICHRILPPTDAMLDGFRLSMESRIDSMMTLTTAMTDNTDPVVNGFSTAVNLIAHPRNNKVIKQKLGRLYEAFCPALKTASFLPRDAVVAATRVAPMSPKWAGVELPPSRPRIGFVAKHWDTQHLGRVMHDLLVQLNAMQFEIFVFAVSPSRPSSPVLADLEQSMEHFIVLPFDTSKSSAEVRARNLDVLVFPELGMDKVTFFLAFAKLAPVQAVWYGSPDTSGVPAIDYYITSEFEKTGHEEHYTEQPFPLKYIADIGSHGEECLPRGMGIYMNMPNISQPPSDDIRALLARQFALPESFHMYLVIEPLLLLHTDMDVAITRILRRDRLGHVFFLSYTKGAQHWQRQFHDRLKLQKKLNVSRVHYIIDLEHDKDLGPLVQAADVVLTSLHANKYYASLLAIAAGVPFVTVPGDLWRTRIPFGFLQQLGIHECVANSTSEYAHIAVRLTQDQSFRAQVVQKIVDNRHRVFQDKQAVAEWTRFLRMAITEARKRRKAHESPSVALS
ncbi:hypothetical protein LEN26_001570 [Aphanomyces euteiches]|nr:hypothetical protein AeMF1_011507 [Aphanomyces euteiches]KAH9161090.1 hypothetical protein LEN26_001570 [Aphanomyces euteiches]KAH9194010.1 hypothetical protein AeNC1_004010 [Aphanomyces euteiches]